MQQRQRKLVGTVVLVLFLALYAVIASSVAMGLLPRATKSIEALFYVIAGLLWTLPAAWLIWWMQRPDPPAGE
jgi:hypothetical protein